MPNVDDGRKQNPNSDPDSPRGDCRHRVDFLEPAPPRSGPGADYLQALVRFEPWAESVWKDDPKIAGAGYFGDGASDGNGGIRGTCGIALAYAVLVREFPQAPERARRLKRVEATL